MTHIAAPPFRHYSGSMQPNIILVGEAFGEAEEESKRPFAGMSGRELFLMLGEAGFGGEEWSRARKLFYTGLGWLGAREDWLRAQGLGMTNVLALRPPDNKIAALCCSKKELPHGYSHSPMDQGAYLRPEYLPELDRLRDELQQLKPNLVVALGNVACWALLGTRGISGLRGTTSQERLTGLNLKVLPTYHPAGVMRNWSWRQIVVGDLFKSRRESGFAEIRRPERSIILNPTIEEVEEWTQVAIKSAAPLSCDTETAMGGITMVGFASSRSRAIVIPFRNFLGGNGPIHYWPSIEHEVRAWLCVRNLLLAPNPKIFQNGLYDLQYFMRLGLRPLNCEEDTMLLHHSILPEMQKGLGFLGSVYTDEPAWKLMRKVRADEPIKADE